MTYVVQLNGGSIKAESARTPEPSGPGALLHGERVTLAHPFGVGSFLRQGWHTFSPSFWESLAAPRERIVSPWRRLTADDPAYADPPRHDGSALGAVRSMDDHDDVILLGALGLGARVRADGERLEGIVEGPAVDWYVDRGPEREVLARYAEQLAHHLGARPNTPPRVWCSWYSYFTEIDEATMQSCLEGVAGLPFDVFQTDDGWQRHIGDWEANDKFPSGMNALATRVRDAGFTPGLWIAPFIAHEHSAIFASHPDWFIADESGAPLPVGWNWDARYYGLDLTRDDVIEHVQTVISRARGWGYDYLKLDFLFGGAMPGQRAGSMPREHAYRRGVEAIREAAGDDCYLLACGAPIVPSIGVFDATRVSPDVAPYWDDEAASVHLREYAAPSTRNAIRTTMHRLWLRPLLATDPDVAFFRTRGNLLSTAQRRLLQDVVQAAGFLATSDPPAWLNDLERVELVEYFAATPSVVWHAPYRFSIDGRDVDVSDVVRLPVLPPAMDGQDGAA